MSGLKTQGCPVILRATDPAGQNVPFNNDDHVTIGTDDQVRLQAESALLDSMP
jgi:hypothetical protein